MNMNKNVEGMRKVRRGLKQEDPLSEFDFKLDDEFFDKLHDKVMAKVAETEMHPAPRLAAVNRARHFVYRYWRTWSYPAGGIMAVFMMAFALAPQMQKINESIYRTGLVSDGTERIIQQALVAPHELSQTFISSQSEADFFIDVARESFENLPDKQLEKLIMGESRR